MSESVAVLSDSAQFGKVSGLEFASPDGRLRWRVVNGQVERSTTRGKSWEQIAMPAGATIIAGHAPRGSVAWFVGTGGAVFLTTNGTTFVRVPFPSKTDLVAVLAVDDRQATVSTADGRIFGTSDRGVTWIRP